MYSAESSRGFVCLQELVSGAVGRECYDYREFCK